MCGALCHYGIEDCRRSVSLVCLLVDKKAGTLGRWMSRTPALDVLHIPSFFLAPFGSPQLLPLVIVRLYSLLFYILLASVHSVGWENRSSESFSMNHKNDVGLYSNENEVRASWEKNGCRNFILISVSALKQERGETSPRIWQFQYCLRCLLEWWCPNEMFLSYQIPKKVM